MSNLQLILDEPSATFYPLSPVNGQLIFESADPIKVKNITVKLCGKAEVKFSAEIDGKHEIFSDEQKIIEKDFPLWSQIDNEKLAAGRHDFSFKFILPQECPPSFIGEKGHICYKLIAKVDIAGGDDLEVEEVITVSPMTYITTNFPVICTTAFNNVNVTATVPFRIFNLNDEIPLSVEIANLSNYAVESIEAGLCWSSTFTGKPHSSDKSVTCDTVKGELDYTNTPFSIPSGVTLTFNQILKSTATLPSVISCPILSHNYLVFVRIHFIGEPSEHVQEFFIPIILSNIALNETVEGGETILPSECVETGEFPKVTVPHSQVEQNDVTIDETHMIPLSDANLHPGNVDHVSHGETPTPAPESLHV